MNDRLTFYKSRSPLAKQRWRWRFQAAGNMEKLAHGGEAYGSLDSAIEGAARVLGLAPSALTFSTLPATIARNDGRQIDVVFKGI